jgi:hypothetical protein
MCPQNSTMKLIIALTLIGAIAQSVCAAGSTLNAEAGLCTPKIAASLDLHVDGNGGFLVPVRIEGHEAWMALSLAGGVPDLFSVATEGWHLSTRGLEGTKYHFAGAVIHEFVIVKELKIGNIVFPNWEMAAIPRQVVHATATIDAKPVVGQLTAKFFQGIDVELDLGQNKLNLFQQAVCGAGVVYWGGEYTSVPIAFDGTGLLVFPMELEKRSIRTSFNTSSRHSYISTEVTQKYFGFDENSPDVQQGAGADGKKIPSFRAMALTAKGLEIRNTPVRLWVTHDFCQPGINAGAAAGIECKYTTGITPFSIGTDLLNQLRIYIATKEKLVYFTRADSNQAGLPNPAEPGH